MAEGHKKIFEPCLTEIEKIQGEIERDLQGPAVSNQENFFRETIKKRPVRRARSWRRTVALLCIVCTLGTGSLGIGFGAAAVYVNYNWFGGINGPGSGESANGTPFGIGSTSFVFNDTTAPNSEGSLSDMIKSVEPSVARVTAIYARRADRPSYNEANASEGSGIIIAQDSRSVYIATNHHVIQGASSVNISISGSAPIKASPAGRDTEADLAVISIEKRDLRNAGVLTIVIAVFGDSDKMEVGDVVIAIGNAMGMGNSTTLGIISAKEKIRDIEDKSLNVLQTNAAINRGNSGGPLFNSRGEVIGINTAKADYYLVEGMGYSIPSNTAKPILDELLHNTRPSLGVYIETVTEETAEILGIPAMGVYIDSIIKGSGADAAGIVRGDIITGFNGNPVYSVQQLIDEVRKCRIGDAVEVKILRDGRRDKPVIIMVTLGAMIYDRF